MNDEKHFLGHRKRLKEKFLKNQESLLDYEILELLLGYALPRKDTKPLAKSLISKFGSLKAILTAKPYELEDIRGVGKGIVLFWSLLKEFLSRVEKEKIISKKVISSPFEVVDFMKTKISFSSKESFWIILLDNKNRVIKVEELFKGTVDQTVVYLREIFSTILRHDASGIILVHNHPGGDPYPSGADKKITETVMNVCDSLDIRLLDHIIVAEEKHFSFRENNLMTSPRRP